MLSLYFLDFYSFAGSFLASTHLELTSWNSNFPNEMWEGTRYLLDITYQYKYDCHCYLLYILQGNNTSLLTEKNDSDTGNSEQHSVICLERK